MHKLIHSMLYTINKHYVFCFFAITIITVILGTLIGLAFVWLMYNIPLLLGGIIVILFCAYIFYGIKDYYCNWR